MLVRSVKLVIVASAVATPCSAQGFSSARLIVDNDFIAIRGADAQDQDYSSGVRLDLTWRIRRAPNNSSQFGLSLGQEMYTPSRDGPQPIAGERAYAAWLFLEPSYSWRGARRVNVLSARLGWIGPPALGEQVQNSVHQLIRSEQHVGWKNQARIGPAYLLSYRVGHVAELHRNGPAVVVQPGMRLSTGNVETSLEAGSEMWAGQKQAKSSAISPAPKGFYAIIGAKSTWKIRDALLRIDPNGPATAVTRRPVVGEALAGCGFAAHRWAIEYRYVARTTEYTTQASPHKYGSLRFTISPPN